MQDYTSGTNRGTSGSWSGGSTGGDLQDSAREVTRDAKGAVTEIAGKAKEQVKTQVATQKERAVSSLDDVTQTLHDTSRQLQENGQDTAGNLMDSVATQIESLTGYLKGRDVDDLLGDLQDIARRNPTLFVGGAFVLGVAAARFMKSSAPYSGSRYDRDAYSAEAARGTDLTMDYRSSVGAPMPSEASAVSSDAGTLYASPSSSAAEATGTYGTSASAAGLASDADTWSAASDRMTVNDEDLDVALDEEEDAAFGTSRTEAI